jgi:solute carrier family 13 (sodium-dependent dicarboxylate transporter), member 2/3/5
MVQIDRRPIWVLFLGKYKNIFVFAGILLLFLFLLTQSIPTGLSQAGWFGVSIFIFCILLWVTQAIPLAITGLLSIVLLPSLQVLPTKESYALFGNEAVFFILGAFVMGAAVKASGLSRRLAFYSFKTFGTSPIRLVMTIFFVATFLSFWMPEHIVAAMLFPIVLDMTDRLKLSRTNSPMGQALFLALAWGCIIGGIATFLGGARNPLAVGLLYEFTGQKILFSEWLKASLPLVIILLIAAMPIFFLYIKKESVDISRAIQDITQEMKRATVISFRELAVAGVIIATVVSWILYSDVLGVVNIALLSSVLLFVLGLLSWQEAQEEINWGLILMYGGAVSLGSAMVKTGAAEWMVLHYLKDVHLSPFILIAMISLVAKFLTEGISNSAVVAFMLPICYPLAAQMNLDPKIVTLSIALPAGLAFMLPSGTPPNAISFGSGFFRVRDMAGIGFVLNIVSWVLFLLVAYFYWPLIGLKF